VVETSGGKQMEFHGSREMASRGGKGFEAVKRTSFTRIVPSAIELVDWDKVEGKGEEKKSKPESNGEQKTLFDE
jgi:hypothetical protein